MEKLPVFQALVQVVLCQIGVVTEQESLEKLAKVALREMVVEVALRELVVKALEQGMR